VRLAPLPDWGRRMEHIEAMSREHAAQVRAGFACQPEAPADLYERFHEYFTAALSADPTVARRVRIVTWWMVDGPHGGDWVVDFTRERDWVSRGVPPRWNLRLKFPATLVYQGVTGQAI